MVKNQEDAVYVAQHILKDEGVRHRFERLCEERHIDKDFLSLTSKVHVYGMALSAVKNRDDRSLSKCCRYILSNEGLRRDFKEKVKEKFGHEPISIDSISNFEHIFAKALSGLGSDPLIHFPHLFTGEKVMDRRPA